MTNYRAIERMKQYSNRFKAWGQFDRYCKVVLRHEAINYFRELQRHRKHEISLEELSSADLDTLSVTNSYPDESHIFHFYGCDLRIDNDHVANAFINLPEQEQHILILRYVLELADGEIGRSVGMSRSAVQRHRTKTLKTLQTQLMSAMIEENRYE